MGTSETALSYGRYEPRVQLGVLQKNNQRKILHNIYYKLFDVVLADTPELKEEAHRLRYQVFCIENQNYEDPANHPDGLEKDDFDSNAEHALLYYKPLNMAIGTVRVIFNNKDDWRKSFPLQGICDSFYLHNEEYAKNSCEFSRFCISRKRRERAKQHVQSCKSVFGGGKGLESLSFYEKPLLNICVAMAPLGLIRGAFELAMRQNVLNIFGVMEPFFIGRLEQVGLVHEKIGPEIEYHGTRIPFICNILETFDKGIYTHQDSWQIVSNKGKNHKRALEVYQNQGASCFLTGAQSIRH